MRLRKRYLVNLNTREIHRAGRTTKACRLEAVKDDNIVYRSRRIARLLIRYGRFNGCRHCWPENDNG